MLLVQGNNLLSRTTHDSYATGFVIINPDAVLTDMGYHRLYSVSVIFSVSFG